jgi:hypothetical protein
MTQARMITTTAAATIHKTRRSRIVLPPCYRSQGGLGRSWTRCKKGFCLPHGCTRHWRRSAPARADSPRWFSLAAQSASAGTLHRAAGAAAWREAGERGLHKPANQAVDKVIPRLPTRHILPLMIAFGRNMLGPAR